jgi:site-specific recombinase XerD
VLGNPTQQGIAIHDVFGYNSSLVGESSSGRTADSGCFPTNDLLTEFVQSRRQGLSPRTIKFYKGYLNHSTHVVGFDVKGQDISLFLNSRRCSNGGKHSYFRALRAFYNWLYSPRSGYRLNPQDNPILLVEPPKVEKRILPSVTDKQVEELIGAADNLRDKCIVSLFADSGTRLSELANIKRDDIQWSTCTVTVIGKGNKQRKAPFTERTAQLLRPHLADNHTDGTIWGINQNGITKVLKTLSLRTGIKCNPHSFRRGFACNLHRKGLSTLDIMHLGGWQDLSMVLRYTRSITFDDCLKHYKAILN